MKPIDPRSSKNPNGWRNVYYQFELLKNLASKLGEPVHKWSVEYPSSIREKVSGNWKIIYTINGRFYVAHVGYNAPRAANGIKQMIESYPRHKRVFGSVDRPIKPKAKPLLTDDPNRVADLFQEWSEGVARVGHGLTEAEYKQQYKHHLWMLSRRAGILDMDMRAYLTRHPHGSIWPNPPRSERELENRQRKLEEMIRSNKRPPNLLMPIYRKNPYDGVTAEEFDAMDQEVKENIKKANPRNPTTSKLTSDMIRDWKISGYE